MSTTNVTIATLAEVLPGLTLQTKAVHDPRGSHQVILAKHLTSGVAYCYQPDHALRLNPKRAPQNYLVYPGDVLFVARGANNHAVAVAEVADNSVAASTCYILRIKHEALLPEYLAWVINQEVVQQLIAQVRTGAGTPIVQRKAFGEIAIPLPPRQTQQQIAQLAVLMGREKTLMAQLNHYYQLYRRRSGDQLMASLMDA